MTRKSHAPADAPPGGFAQVAKQISRWTINLIATGAVLLLMLVLGQQLNEYWRGASAPANSPGAKPVAGTHRSESGPAVNAAEIEFGDEKFALLQSQVKGDRAAAAAALRGVCRKAAQSLAPAAPLQGGPQPAEARLLKLLGSEEPTERLDDQTELFELPGPAPMAIVTTVANSAAVQSEGRQGKVAATTRRVLTWGIALPMGQNAWTVFAFHPRDVSDGIESVDPKPGPHVAASPKVPLPEGAELIMSIRRDTGRVAAFRAGDVEDVAAVAFQWRAFYDRWAATEGWTASGDWKENGGVWRMRLSRASGPTTDEVEIQFGPDGHGGLRGFITTTQETAQGG